MKEILNIITIFLTTIVFSQKNYIIHYKIQPLHGSIEEAEDIKNSRLKYLYQDLDEVLSSLKGTLIVNDKTSSFIIDSEYSKNPRALRLAKSFAGNDEFYYGIEDSLNIRKKNFLNEEFYIIDNIIPDWTITNEFKMIDNYKCYKATTEKSVIIKEKVKIHTVTAWFCPEVPISFGPKEFRGLPGLIFELHDDKVSYNLDRIENKYKKVIFDLKKKNKFITQEDFDKIVKEKREDFLGKTKY